MQNNPYVGPRPYRREDSDKFFGRNREARDLVDMLMAERVVLFYAQSGAGKSSLLNAKVIPDLEAQGFHVLPPLRVGADVPPDIDPRAIHNIFIFSSLLSLVDPDTPPETLVDQTLSTFLQTFNFVVPHESESNDIYIDEGVESLPATSPPSLPILIWDQFEELFTTHRGRWQEATAFFEQVAEALESIPELGVVFVMREDHVAAIEPYAQLLPRRLRARFRIERLGYEGGLQAIRKPAKGAGCPFDEGVAERLVDNLRRIRGQGPGSDVQEQEALGPYVEPVQLQVVCSRLWENLPEQEDRLIQWEEVAEFGDVDQALSGFYEDAVARCMRDANVGERNVRRWFAQQLITPLQTRGLVLRGADETGGLPNVAVDVLEGLHIIRAEARAGARWYELSHDRLVEPVIGSNRAWEEARQTPLRMAAKEWQETGDDSLLYRGAALNMAVLDLDARTTYYEALSRDASSSEMETITAGIAEKLGAKLPPGGEVEPYEREFIEASQQAERARRRRRYLSIAGTVFGVLIVALMTVLTILAFRGQQAAEVARATAELKQEEAEAAWATAEARRVEAEEAWATAEVKRQEAEAAESTAEAERARAEEQARIATSRQLAAESVNELRSDHPDLALLMAIEALKTEHTQEAVVALREVLAVPSATRLYLARHPGGVDTVRWSPDEAHILTSGRDGTARVWDSATGKELLRLEHNGARVRAAEWNGDGSRVLTGCEHGTTHIWDAQTGEILYTFKQDLLVAKVAWSADETRILTVQGQTHIWDVAAGLVLLSLPGISDGMINAVWSPDETLIFLDGNGRAQLWDAQTGELLITMEHEGWSYNPQWSADGSRVLTAGGGYKARIWDVSEPRSATGKELLTFVGHESTVRRAVWNHDERQILTVSDDKTARVWDSTTGEELLILEGHTDWLWYGAWDVTERYILTASWDGTARVWEAETGALYATLIGHTGDILAATWNRTGEYILTGSLDGTARMWELALAGRAGGELPAMSGHTEMCRQARWSSDETRILTASDDDTARIWDAQTGEEERILQADAQDVWAVAWSHDDRRVLGGYYKSEGEFAYVWDAQTGDQVLALAGYTDGISHVAWSADDAVLLTASWDGSARLWDAQMGAEIQRLEHTAGIWYASWDKDERRIVTCGDDNVAKLWNVQTEELLFTLEGHGSVVVRAAWSADGKRILTASADGTARMWDTETGEEVLVLEDHVGWVYDVAWSHDDRLILTGDGEAAHIWDAQTGEQLFILDGHTDAVKRVRWRQDGSQILTASDDGTARIWDAATGSEFTILVGHNGAVLDVHWNMDESRVLTAGADGVARQFYTDPHALLEAACQQAVRNMTQEEWDMVMGKDIAYRTTCPNLSASP